MSVTRTLLVAGADAGLAGAVRAAAREIGRLRVETAPKSNLSELHAEAAAAAVVLAVIDASRAGALDDVQRLARTLPDRRIVVAATNAGGEDVRRLFRAGAADVLTPPFTAEAVAGSLVEVLRALAPAAPEAGQVVSVIKACGGAGATTAALNLAAALVQGDPRRGRPPRAAALLDLDLQFGDSDVALDLQPKSSLVDLLRAPERVDAYFLQTVMTEHASGLKLLAPPPTMVPADALTPELAVSLIDHAASLFDRVVVDLPGVWTDWTVQVLARSDMVILVSTPTVAGAVGVRRTLEALKEARISRPVFFALNKLAGVIDAFEKPARIGRTLELGVDAALMLDPAAPKAADRGKLLLEASPNCRLAKDVRAMAARLEDRLEALASGLAVAEPAA